MNWIQAASQLSDQNIGFVVITVLNAKGSTPRGRQSKMVVTKENTYDSIGGGNLEFEAMQKAWDLLADNTVTLEIHSYTLGSDLSQCCGGQVELLYECYPSCDLHVVVLGAGHVGKALVPILDGLPCRTLWADSREDYCDMASQHAGDNVSIRQVSNPFEFVEQCPAGSYYLIMTHSHEMDFEFCEAVLGRSDNRFCGLIGSRSKAAGFRSRLKKKGFSERELTKLTSPIGLELGAGKRPMEVAVSVSAQLLQLFYTG